MSRHMTVRRWRHKTIDSKKKSKKKGPLTEAEKIKQVKQELIDLGLTQNAASKIVTKHKFSIKLNLDYNKKPEEIASRLERLIKQETKTK